MLKKNLVRLSSLSLLFALMMNPQAEARIPIIAIKGITKNFKKGQEFNSPTFGEAALLSGWIYNLRFYGNVTPTIINGKREYVYDKGQDGLSRLIIVLFPSPSGALNIETTTDDNFGKRIESPSTVALLLNFAHDVRNKKIKTDKDLFTYTNKVILPTFGLKSDDKSLPNLRTKVNLILRSIRDSIEKESTDPYPKYMTEQVINAFFCEKFSTQEDIRILLTGMSPDIVNKEAIPQKDDLLKEEELESIAHKENPYNADDVWALANADIFRMNIPYKPGIPLISNGNARPYQREWESLEKMIGRRNPLRIVRKPQRVTL